jgi:hypothetical protein
VWIKTLTNPASETGTLVDIVLRLTAIDLLLRPTGPWTVKPVIIALAGLSLLMPKVMRAPATWFALSGLVAARIVWDWPIPDNHLYLLAYWCLALALALGSVNCQRVLAGSSSLLIGLVFLLAFMWKAGLSPDYVDGRFFRVTLLTDTRFEDSVLLFGGLTPHELEGNRDFLEPVDRTKAAAAAGPKLVEPPPFRRLASMLTWSALIVEGLVALTWLWSFAAGWTQTVRHLLLLIFCAGTYAFAPVAGFGWLLLTMGLVSTRPQQRWLRGAYIASWILVLLYAEVPWAELLLDLRSAL